MIHALKLHPDSRCEAVEAIEVEIARRAHGLLTLHYRVTGAISDLRIPAHAAQARADELWRHTCFEVFVRPAVGAGYFEFNFSPSTQWAAYSFTGYREGMANIEGVPAPRIHVEASDSRFGMKVLLDLHGIAGLPPEGDWTLGVSSVIEETSGNRSYWAVANRADKADFHHADGFVLKLPGC